MEADSQKGYTNDDKLRWEVEKLRAEAKNLNRPYVKTPSSWLTIMTAIVGIFGIGIQYIKSDNAYQLAEIKRQQTILEIEQAKSARQQVFEEISDAKNTLAQLQSQREQLSQTLNGLQAKAQELQNRASAGEIKQVVNEVSESIKTLSTINDQSSSQSERTARNLETLTSSLTNRTLQSPAFAVIASYNTLGRAIDYAKGLKNREIAFPIEIYRRSPIRYAVTLGGYLTPEEASKRVEYAKQLGIAPDAYVRFAQDWGDNLHK